MKGFGIYVQNDLLETKHIQNMGEAVWLYMWLLDKMTSVNENGIGKVLGGKPITHLDLFTDLGIHRNTYVLWVSRLRETGYISTIRTPRGLVITVNKAKKGSTRNGTSQSKVMHMNRSITKPTDAHETVHHKTNSDAHEQGSDAHESVHAEDAHETNIQYKTKQSRLNNDVSTNVLTTEHKVPNTQEQVSKLYYEAIKSLDLPVRNHSIVKSKISELSKSSDIPAVLGYLTFMRDQYVKTTWDYKPDVSEALDIFTKRIKIKNSIDRYVAEKQANQPVTFGRKS